MDAAVTLAKNIVNTKYEDIPTEILKVTKKQILDILACILGGSTALGCKQVVELVREWAGKEESTILAYGDRVPAPHAVLANATMGDALDYDDTSDDAGLHTGTIVIPACFAMAERKGKVGGEEFLTGVALGVDMIERMGLATKRNPDSVRGLWGGWEGTPLYGFIGAAAAAGKILRLDEERMVNAIGIAYAQTSGNMQSVRDGALTKRISPGFAAKGGVISALMAEKGITGSTNSLEGLYGLYNLYHRPGDYNPHPLTADLGVRFEGAIVSSKPYPCCRTTHPSIDAALALAREHAVRPQNIAEITVTSGPTSVSCTEPLEVKRSPKTLIDAQFSIPWTVATAIVYGNVQVKDFTPEAIKKRAVLEIASKVNCKVDWKLNIRSVNPAIVEIRTNDGSVLSKRVDFALGSPQNPMSWESIIDKFWECASLAVKPIPKENLEKVVEMVSRLEELDDVSSVIRVLN